MGSRSGWNEFALLLVFGGAQLHAQGLAIPAGINEGRVIAQAEADGKAFTRMALPQLASLEFAALVTRPSSRAPTVAGAGLLRVNTSERRCVEPNERPARSGEIV